MPEKNAKQVPVPETEETEEIIYNDLLAEFLKGNQNEPGCWGHGPAYLELNKGAVAKLAQIYQHKYNKQISKVEYVRSALQSGTKVVWIYPSTRKDPNSIKVLYGRSKAWVNLISLLGPNKLTIESGYRERFDIHVNLDSPVGPALELDLSRIVERRVDTKTARKRIARDASPTT